MNETNQQVAKGSFKLLDVMHHLTAGLKAISTDMVYFGID